jgi:hypothetical protein
MHLESLSEVNDGVDVLCVCSCVNSTCSFFKISFFVQKKRFFRNKEVPSWKTRSHVLSTRKIMQAKDVCKVEEEGGGALTNLNWSEKFGTFTELVTANWTEKFQEF